MQSQLPRTQSNSQVVFGVFRSGARDVDGVVPQRWKGILCHYVNHLPVANLSASARTRVSHGITDGHISNSIVASDSAS